MYSRWGWIPKGQSWEIQLDASTGIFLFNWMFTYCEPFEVQLQVKQWGMSKVCFTRTFLFATDRQDFYVLFCSVFFHTICSLQERNKVLVSNFIFDVSLKSFTNFWDYLWSKWTSITSKCGQDSLHLSLNWWSLWCSGLIGMWKQLPRCLRNTHFVFLYIWSVYLYICLFHLSQLPTVNIQLLKFPLFQR